MQMIRSFIAVEIPDNVRSEITRIISKTAENDFGVKWVKHENLHITLLFLGDVTNEFLQKGINELSAIAQTQKPFEMSFKNIGAFPSPRSPRIIWVGVEQGKNELTALQEKTENAFTGIGYKPEERKFHPHLTIGRVKERMSSTKVFETEYISTSFLIKSVVLFKSTLMPQGPIYEKIKEFYFLATDLH